MAGAEAVETLARDRQDHPRREDAVAFHQEGAVMEGRVGGEQVQDQVHRQLGIEGDAGIEEVFGPQVTAEVEHDQATPAQLGELPRRLRQHRHSPGGQLVGPLAAKQHIEAAGAEQLHQPAQISLPKDRQGQAAGQHQRIHQLAGEGQVGVALHHPGQGHQQQVAPQQPEGSGFLNPGQEHQAKGCRQQQIEQQPQIDEPQPDPLSKPPEWIQATGVNRSGSRS